METLQDSILEKSVGETTFLKEQQNVLAYNQRAMQFLKTGDTREALRQLI